ncbi:PREDICTED: origin recognition complex subunit 4 isoform X2 [Papilio polytes]|uniref:origin recognition complex subunit 4 isoform X2 n=1 Tax=Papilio polytes TaxID=76194 RepID=UPI0006766062|nr:PREDICTED: origin recognition complex subunit 4 isoform X2 [Papilio polytes]
MCETYGVEPLALNIKLIRKYLKIKVLEDNVQFQDHEIERNHVHDLIKRVVSNGESHSALVIGPRGCGKTTLINSVLGQLESELDLENDCLIIKLNGLLHQDDKIALKSITAQMQLENAVGDRVFGTFAENLSFLLSCLQSGVDRSCKSMVFILEEFDLFCHSGRTQTLLYNLFDITHNKQAPMCVLGITNRLDVMEMLEKRVKSRFSHRHIFIFPNDNIKPVDNLKVRLIQLLSVPLSLIRKHGGTKKKRGGRRKSMVTEEEMEVELNDDTIQYSVPAKVLARCRVDPKQFQEFDENSLVYWSSHILSLVENKDIVNALEKLCYFTVNEQIFRNILFQVVSRLNETSPHIDVVGFVTIIDNTVGPEHRVKVLQSLSTLELSLVIAMKHGMDIFDGQPMNFEMVLHRYKKFVDKNSSTQTVPRPVILKAFEHLQELEVIMPVRSTDSIYSMNETTTSGMQKEYKLYTLAVPEHDLKEAVKTSKSLPTEISFWFNSEIF